MLSAHLGWASRKIPDHLERLRGVLAAEHHGLLGRPILATEWVPFASVVALDRAIAELTGMPDREVFEALGRESARSNLRGAYRSFQAGDPHKIFGNMALLHRRFQNFGDAVYRHLGDRNGEFLLVDCTSYSPVHCAGALGYLSEVLVISGATVRPRVEETACVCEGTAACIFDLGW